MIHYLEEKGLELAEVIAQFLARKGVTPLQVTTMRFVIATPLSLYLFSRGSYIYNLIGLFSYMVLAIFDWVDGKLARIKKLPEKTKPLGKFVDYTSDRILILIVFASIFYAGTFSEESKIWIILIITYYSIFFFLTTLLHDFDQMFHLDFKRYPDIEKEMDKLDKLPSRFDMFLYNLINVHKSSLSKFCFSVSYVLFAGIIFNRLLATFTFITLMMGVRSAGMMYIMYSAVKTGNTHSSLIRVLRNHLKENVKKTS